MPNGWKKICTKSAKTGKGWEVKLINPNRELINKYVINDIQFCYEKSRGLKFKKCVLCHFHAVKHKPDLIINHYKDKHGFDNLNLRSLVLSEFIFEKMLHSKYVKVWIYIMNFVSKKFLCTFWVALKWVSRTVAQANNHIPKLGLKTYLQTRDLTILQSVSCLIWMWQVF